MGPNEELTPDRSPPGPMSLPEAMLDGLQRLTEVYSQRLRYPHDDTLRIRLGYLCAIAGRQAATEVYRLTNQIDSITPGLPQTDKRGEVTSSLLTFLRQVMSGEILRDPDDPLLRLMTNLQRDRNLFSVGESAIRSAVALLRLTEYGGVLAAWQLQALAFNLMSWADHVAFNERILEYARGLCPESAWEAARKYELPGPDYLEAGCLGNIVNASYRVALLHPGDARGQAARARGDRALEEVEKRSSPELKKTMLLGCLQVTRAACAAVCGDGEAARRHWDSVARADLPRILDDIARTEPCVPARELVLKTTREAFGF